MDFLNVDLSAPKMSNVDLTHSNRLTMSPGYIYPTMVLECLPSDRIRLNLKTILKSDPTVSSLYGSFRQSHQAYFVPARLYVKGLDQNSTFGNESFGMIPDEYPKFPSVTWTTRLSDGLMNGPQSGVVDPGSLLETLGMFPTDFSIRDHAWYYDDSDPQVLHGTIGSINAVPLIGYYDILRNYYFNAQEPAMPIVEYETREVPGARPVRLVNVTKSQLDQFISEVYEDEVSDIFAVMDSNNLPSLFYGYNDYDANELFSDRIGSDDDSLPLKVHAGYGVRTFDDDYFTTFLSNEFVDEIDNNARVLVNQQTNSFTVNQLRRAYRLDKHNNRNLLGAGNSYDDYIYVHFNTSLGRELNKPYFLGSYTSDFYFNDIYAQSQNSDPNTNNGSLGDRAGVLNASADARDFVDFTCKEYGYLIVVSSIIPRIDYHLGIPKLYLKTSMADMYAPEFDAWGYQGIPNIEVDATNRVDDQFDVTQKQPAWMEHMTMFNRVHGLFTTNLEHSFQVLTKSKSDYFYPLDRDQIAPLRSSYVRPWDFNYIFEFQQSWYDHFTMQILFDCNAYRPISKQILPTL